MRIAALTLMIAPVAVLAQPASNGAATAGAPTSREDKVVCKSFTEVGSLIATHKECKTRREWEQEASANQKQLSDCTSGAGATGARC